MEIYAWVRLMLRKTPRVEDQLLDKSIPKAFGTQIIITSMRKLICGKSNRKTSTSSHTPKTLTLLESTPHTFP
jgi:hypothetical protein